MKQTKPQSGHYFDHLRGLNKSHNSESSEIRDGTDLSVPENDWSDGASEVDVSQVDVWEEVNQESQVAESSGVDNRAHIMPSEARRALVHLLRQGVVLASRNSHLFDAVCLHQDILRNHLANMYLSLVLDEKGGVGFIKSIEEGSASEGDEEDEAVSLITRRTLSLFDTLLLLVLRKHYQEREASGEQKIIIHIDQVESNLSPFLTLTNNSVADRRKLGAAMKKMTEKRILNSVRGSEDRFEVTPIIRYVVNAAFLEEMLGEYLRLAEEGDVELGSGTISEVEGVVHGQE